MYLAYLERALLQLLPEQWHLHPDHQLLSHLQTLQWLHHRLSWVLAEGTEKVPL